MKSKSKNAVTIPTKAAVPKPTPAKPIAKKQAEVLKVKQVKTTAKSSQEAPQQQPQAQLQLSDFKMQMKADANNLHVTTTYQGTPIHAIILPAQEFAGWQRATQQQRYAYIQARVNPATFNNDLRLVQIIITSYVKRINTVFSIAQAQQQAQRRQQQAQRLVR